MKKQREKLEEMRKWGTRNTEEKKKYRWERERKKMRKKKYRWKRARPKVDVEIEKATLYTLAHTGKTKSLFVSFLSGKNLFCIAVILFHTQTHTHFMLHIKLTHTCTKKLAWK
jgi:hypothetical protein